MRRKPAIIFAIVCIVGGTAVCWYAPRGLLFPLRIASGSMSPTLQGPHWSIDCPACEFRFTCCVESPPQQAAATCPNCGESLIALHDSLRRPGQRVWIESRHRRRQPVRRWQIVAFYDADQGGKRHLVVKRVVGLPGEQIEIRDGDIWAQGEIVRKSFDEYRAQAVLVHDDQFRPTADGATERWRSLRGSAGWRATDAGYEICPSGDEPIWLTYQHRACIPPPGDPRRPMAIVDNDPQNQGQSRPLFFVRDIALASTLQSSSAGMWQVKMFDGDRWWELQWDEVHRMIRLFENQQLVLERATKHDSTVNHPCPIWLALVDGQFIFVVREEVWLSWEYALPSTRPESNDSPVSLSWMGTGRATVTAVQIWRDLYWLHPYYLPDAWASERRLNDDEYLVLGDNGPLSVDGRTRSTLQNLPYRSILGRVQW